MGPNRTIDLTADQHRLLLELIECHLPDTDIWAYGSRVTWNSRPQSDLDLVVFSGPEQTGQVSDLREAFEESRLPFRVDVLVWDDLPESFQREIDARHYAIVEIHMVFGGVTKMRFGNCATLVRDHVDPNDIPGDTPYVGLGHIPKNQLAVADHGVASDVGSTKCRFKRGDILFGKLNPHFRKVAQAQYDGICSTDIWVVRAQKGIDQRFLFYQMSTQRFVDYASGGSEGTSMPRAKWDHVSGYGFDVPKLAEQRRIAEILGSLDDKIDVNRRMVDVLDRLSCAMYQEWFVEFGVEKGDADTESNMFRDLWSQLLNTSEESKQPRNIPRGWHVRTLRDIMTIHRRTVRPSHGSRQLVEHYSIPAFDVHGDPLIEPEGNIKSAKTVVPAQPVVLLSRLNPDKPRVWIPNRTTGRQQLASTEFLVCESTSELGQGALYCLFRSKKFQEVMRGMVTGTSRSHQRVLPTTLLRLPVIVGPRELHAQFERLAKPVITRMLTIRRETATLRSMVELLRQQYIN